MQYMQDPRQNLLWDPYEQALPPVTYKKLRSDWQGVMRGVLLELMPVEILADKRHETLGRPTKELYSVAGMLFIKEFRGWTMAQAVEDYCLNVGVQFALNLPPMGVSICERTMETYQAFFREEDAGAIIFERVTAALVDALNIKVDKQRGDSVHLFSDMALFGRTQLMGVAVKRFLAQLIRHDREAYDALDQALRERYAPSTHRLFADTRRDKESGKRIRQTVAEDMLALIRRFEHDEKHHARTSFKAVVRIFFEQCELTEERVTVKVKAGGRVMQNPSDPDATYDGKKGAGYQAQIAQTCAEENEVQFITGVIPQTAADTDAESAVPMLCELKESGRLPASMLLDAAYGSDSNVQAGKQDGVEFLQSHKAPNGGWSGYCGSSVDTAFAVLFLLRSTQKSIQAKLGEGLLLSGRGLPTNLARVRMRRGQIVVQQVQTQVDTFLALVDDDDLSRIDELADDPSQLLVAKVDANTARQLQQLVRGGQPEVRRLAVRALARTGNLDYVPSLIYALSDPDRRIVVEARNGLRFISRRFAGFGLPNDFTEKQRFEAISAWKEWYLALRPDAVLPQ